MKIKAGFSLTVIAAGLVCASNGEEVAMTAEKAMVITFPSQTQRNYKLLGAENASGNWATLKDGIVGTGGEVTIFYKSESDQKLFFKVETSDGPAGQRSLLSLANLDISNKDLSGYDLEGDDLRGYRFNFSKFDGANLSAANLSGAWFNTASFVGADLSHAIAEGVIIEHANFNGANLEGIRFVGGRAGHADFRNAKLKGVKFSGTVLQGANFAGQTLTNVSFWGLNVSGANFTSANFAGADFSRSDATSIILTDANITGVKFDGTLLGGVDFSGKDLRAVSFHGADLSAGNWSSVNAAGANMFLASVNSLWNPAGATFEGANLEGLVAGSSDFQWAITNVNFRNANLRGAYLEGMIFRNCDFTGADLSFANVIAANFTGCTGLDAELPGMQFGGWPQNPPPAPQRPTATILQNGSARVGTNPGDGLAPAAAPAKLRFVITDGGVNRTVDLQLSGGGYHEAGVPTGTYIYSPRGRIAVIRFNNHLTAHFQSRTLVFTSPTVGDLYANDAATYQIGTFTLPE